MQALCGLQGIFDLFNCKTPGCRKNKGLRFSGSVLVKNAGKVYTFKKEQNTGKLKCWIRHRRGGEKYDVSLHETG